MLMSLLEVGFDETAGQLLGITGELLEPEEFVLQLAADLGIGRVGVDVVEFPGISRKVVKFPGVNVIVEVDELIPLGTDPIMALDHVDVRKFVIVIVDRLGPPGYPLGRGKRQK
jgi:hypothetical protein